MIVLDTSALSAVMHGRANALARLAKHPPRAVVLSAPAAAEVLFGIERLRVGSRRRRDLEAQYRRYRALVRWQDWNEAAAVEFARIKAALAERGAMIEDMDIALGAVARCMSAPVATLNAKHFDRIEGLAVEDWSGD